MTSPRAIFFDLDDTLVDDTGCFELSIEGVCSDMGPPFEAAALKAAYEATSLPWWPSGDVTALRVKLWTQALETCGYDPSLAPKVVDRYSYHRLHTVTAYDGAAALLEALRSTYRLAVVTNGGGDIQRLRLQRTGLGQYFEAIVASTDVDAGKPDPRIFRHTLRALGVAPDETWHVGDSLVSDIAGALNAGLQAAVWYNCNGAVCRTDDPQPHHQIAALSDLPGLLAASR
jgi:HAD superfamily hydrolase (TIGR01549 family)